MLLFSKLVFFIYTGFYAFQMPVFLTYFNACRGGSRGGRLARAPPWNLRK